MNETTKEKLIKARTNILSAIETNDTNSELKIVLTHMNIELTHIINYY